MSPRSFDRRRVRSTVRWVSGVHDQAGVGLEQEVASATAEERPSHQSIAAEGVAAVKLLVHRLLASRAAKLTVECFLSLSLRGQGIHMTLDHLPRKFWVEFAEHRHV